MGKRPAILSCLALAAAVVAAVGSIDSTIQSPPQPGAVVTPGAERPKRPVRDVTPPSMIRSFRAASEISDTLSRQISAGDRLFGAAGQAGADAAEPSADRIADASTLVRFDRPKMSIEGAILGKDRTFRLYGVVLPSREKVCVTGSGQRWACGQRIYIALQNRIAGHPLTCEIRDEKEQRARCRSLGEDISVWLLRQGMAELEPSITSRELSAAQRVAQLERRGIWSDH